MKRKTRRTNTNKSELWYQAGWTPAGLYNGQRYRLLYQNESGYWVMNFSFWDGVFSAPNCYGEGCFSIDTQFKTKNQALKAMRKYDRESQFPKAIKVGDFL